MFESIIKILGCVLLTFPYNAPYFQRFYPNALALIGYVVMPNTNGAERPHHWCAGSTPF